MRQKNPAASFIFYEVPVSGRISDDGSYLPIQHTYPTNAYSFSVLIGTN